MNAEHKAAQTIKILKPIYYIVPLPQSLLIQVGLPFHLAI